MIITTNCLVVANQPGTVFRCPSATANEGHIGLFLWSQGALVQPSDLPLSTSSKRPNQSTLYKGRLWSQLSLEARSICRPADCTSLGLLSHFPSSYSNDPILIHIGTSPNWCQVSDFNIHHWSTSNKSWHTSPASWCLRPEVYHLQLQESVHMHEHTHTQTNIPV